MAESICVAYNITSCAYTLHHPRFLAGHIPLELRKTRHGLQRHVSGVIGNIPANAYNWSVPHPNRFYRSRLRQEDALQEGSGGYCATRPGGTPQLPDPKLRWPAISCLSSGTIRRNPLIPHPPPTPETNTIQRFHTQHKDIVATIRIFTEEHYAEKPEHTHTLYNGKPERTAYC